MTESTEITCYPRPDLGREPKPGSALHLAIGMFDGVHLGHRVVMQQAIDAANRQAGHISAVLTFDPHPSHILYPERATRLLMGLQDRIDRIHRTGVDVVYVQPFTTRYAKQSASEFVPLLKKLFSGLKSLHVGENFRFGAGRAGDIATLRESAASHGVEVHALERRLINGQAISSSRIRTALTEGAMASVNAMLGEPYRIQGTVIRGKGIGKKLAFPTVNVPWTPEVAPRFGVYRVDLQRQQTGKRVKGIANYGLRPTVESSSDPVLEVHLLEGDSWPVPGERIEVELLDFIRPEMKFGSTELLAEQISKDIEALRSGMMDQDCSS